MKTSAFTLKIEPELRAEFMAAVRTSDRSAGQLVREFMRAFVDYRRRTPPYDEFTARHARRAAARKTVPPAKNGAAPVAGKRAAAKSAKKRNRS